MQAVAFSSLFFPLGEKDPPSPPPPFITNGDYPPSFNSLVETLDSHPSQVTVFALCTFVIAVEKGQISGIGVRYTGTYFALNSRVWYFINTVLFKRKIVL